MRKFILPYRKGSQTAKLICAGIGGKMLRLENSAYKARDVDLIINWGNSNPNVDLGNARILNKPDYVKYVSNKKHFFEAMSNFDVKEQPRIPAWTLNKDEAQQWYEEGNIVFIRTKLTGHSGQGIVVCDPKENNTEWDLIDNKGYLFVKYVKKKTEFRVHFFDKEIFDVQRKGKRLDRKDVDYLIRSYDNGFVFVRNDLGPVPDDVLEQAQKAINALDLDFGAIDIIYNKLRDEATVLEVNSAPGLDGTTLEKYIDKFEEVIGE